MRLNPQIAPGSLLVAMALLSSCAAEPVALAASARGAPVPTAELPSAPTPERRNPTPVAVEPLAVPGFRPASHVGPEIREGGPHPVTVVLHGNYDRPEWECEVWRRVAAFRGFVLCPRGVPVQGIDPALDRWTYPNLKAAGREIAAALTALERRYPGQVSRQHMVLVGFSLGAIFAPKLAVQDEAYETLFLVEGGLEQLEAVGLAALEAKGVRRIGLAMSGPGRRKQAERWMKTLTERSLPAVYVDMSGAGHNYSSDFEVTGRVALETLLRKP